MTHIHTPYDPESVTGEFGWLWLADGPSGPDWHLVQTYDEGDGDLATWFVGDGDAADRHRGAPYLGANRPIAMPGESDRLEVLLRLAAGASVAWSIGDPDDAAAMENALLQIVDHRSGRHATLDVLAERQRQINVEGWTPEHDDAHSHGELARAALAYVLWGAGCPGGAVMPVPGATPQLLVPGWPFAAEWWKPTTRRRDLVKATALLLAEIERLDRAACQEAQTHD